MIVPTYLKHSKRGKPIGNPVIDFVFQFNTAMNTLPVDDTNNYELDWVSTKRVKKTVKDVYHAIKVQSAVYSSSTNTVTLATLAQKTIFRDGGRLTVIATAPNGVESVTDVYLDGNNEGVAGDDGIFTITANANRITRG